MPIDGGYGTDEMLQVVVPQAATNLVINPSFETNTAGWTATNATITQTAGVGVFGAYGGRMLASATNGNIAMTLASVASGTLGVASAWITASSALVRLKVVIGATTQTVAHPGDGASHRLDVPITAPSTTTPVITIEDTRASAWTNVDIDGVVFETGVTAATTYIDGDQDGCSWLGAAHGSISTRDGRSGYGGALVTFKSLGLHVKSLHGIGAPPVDNLSQKLALSDGALFQGARKRDRVMTFMGVIFGNGGLASLHSIRNPLFDAINPDVRTNRGPVTLRYTGQGNANPRLIEAYYEAGMEWDDVQAADQEIPLRFWCPNPDWQRETDSSASLTVAQTLSPVSAMAMRNADGTWTTLAGGVTANVAAAVRVAEELTDGRVVLAGGNLADFGAVAAADNLGVWDGTAWAVLGSAAPNGAVLSGALGNDGALYISGAPGTFSTVGGVTVNGIAKWDGSTWSVVGAGGLVTGGFLAMAVDPATGYLWAAGDGGGAGGPYPTTAGGVTVSGLGVWNGSAWSAVSQTGLPANWTIVGSQCLVVGPDGRMYLAVLSATTKGIYVWGGSSWSLFAASSGTSNGIAALLSARGRLYAGGYFTGLGGVVVSNVAELTGSGISAMGGGVVTSTTVGVRSFAATPDGRVHIGGRDFTSVGGITLSDSIATWDGSTWRAFSVAAPDTGTHANDSYAIRSTRSGRLVLSWASTGGTFGTTATAEAITTVWNDGTAPAYPVIDFSGGATLYTIENLTTGQKIDFSGCNLVSGETARLDLRRGRKTFATLVRNLVATVLPGSDLATFCLAPGVNRISMYATGGTGAISWRTHEWGAD